MGDALKRLTARYFPDEDRLPQRGRRKPWGTRRTIGAAVAGYLVVVGWLAAGIALALLLATTGDWAAWILALSTFSAMVPLWAVGAWLGGHSAGWRAFFLGMAPVLVIGILGGVAAPELVLVARGQDVTAKIVAAHRETNGKGAVSYSYTLRSTDGTPIAGLLPTGDKQPRPVGARVDVVADPDGVAPPDFAVSVRTQATITTSAATGGLVLLAGLIAWLAARGERQRRLWQRPSRRALARRSRTRLKPWPPA